MALRQNEVIEVLLRLPPVQFYVDLTAVADPQMHMVCFLINWGTPSQLLPKFITVLHHTVYSVLVCFRVYLQVVKGCL